ECHLLQLALAAAIANRAIKRMVREQKLSHATLRLLDLFALRRHHHPVRADDGAGRLQLRHLLDTHETHATRSLQREIRVITKRWNIETLFTADVDQPRT